MNIKNVKKTIIYILFFRYITFNTLCIKCSNDKNKKNAYSGKTKQKDGEISNFQEISEDLKDKKKGEDLKDKKNNEEDLKDKKKGEDLKDKKNNEEDLKDKKNNDDDLEEKNKKEKIKNLQDSYEKRLTIIKNEIGLLKTSIKQYFDEKKFDETKINVDYIEKEIPAITDPDDKSVENKLEKLENEELKNLKSNILEYLRTKFSNLKPKDKDNDLKIEDKNFDEIGNSDNISTEKLKNLYISLCNFEDKLNCNINEIIKDIKDLYDELISKKSVVLDILKDNTLNEKKEKENPFDDDEEEEKNVDDKKEKLFDLEKDNIKDIDEEKDINELITIKTKLINLKDIFFKKFQIKTNKVEKIYKSLKNEHDNLIGEEYQVEKINKLTIPDLKFKTYLENYDAYNKEIEKFKLQFLEKIRECKSDYLKSIEEINKEVEDINKEIDNKNDEIEKINDEIENKNKEKNKFFEEIDNLNSAIKEIIDKNDIENTEGLNEISYDDIKLEAVDKIETTVKKIENYEETDNGEDPFGENNDENDENDIDKLIEELKNIINNIKNVKNVMSCISDCFTNVDNTIDSIKLNIGNIDNQLNNLKEIKKQKEECLKNNIFTIFESDEDKNTFYDSSEKIKFDVFLEINENFEKIKKQQEEIGYSEVSRKFLDKIIEEYIDKFKEKISQSIDLEILIDEEKYNKCKNQIKEKNVIDEGSFGKIYNLNNGYVLKVIDKKSKIFKIFNIEDVKNEILFSYIFKDEPNIVKLHDFFEYDNNIYLILKYYKNGDLSKFMRIFNNEYIKKKICYQLITALSKLHKKGIAHRDIKLENIFIDENKDACLADLGGSIIYDTNKKYLLNLNLFSYPDEYIYLTFAKYNENITEDKMDLFKNDIFALGLSILSLEVKELLPNDLDDKDFIKNRNDFIKKKDSIKDKDLKELLNIMLSQDLKVGNNIDEILNSNYYKRIKKNVTGN